jgi:hypothetical protein
MREFTQQDLQIIQQTELKLRETGIVLITEEEVDAAHNAERLIAFFNHNSHLPVTLNTVLEAFRLMHDQLRFKPRVQVEYEAEYDALSQENKNIFGAWWFSSSTKKTIVIDGDQGFSNAAKVLAWMHGKPFSSRNLDLAITNLAGSRGSLYWAPTPKHTDPRQHQDSGSFMSKDSVNLSARDHAQRARQAQADNTPAPAQTEPAEVWQTLCQRLLGHGTHGCQAAMAKLYDQRGNKPWRQLYTEMNNIARSYERTVSLVY